MKKIFALSSAIGFLLLAGCNPPSISTQTPAQSQVQTQFLPKPTVSLQPPVSVPTQPSAPSQAASAIFPPLSNAKSRITKKTFGMYITPKTSPVQPERFTGYHSGADFETLPDEQNTDVPVFAICSGQLILKEWASGYGGVMVQQCTVANEPVTVIYGHMRLASITFAKGDQIPAGAQLGLLGTGFSKETDGERKHLHLGIHKGASISILGYVQNKAGLSNWLDAEQFLP